MTVGPTGDYADLGEALNALEQFGIDSAIVLLMEPSSYFEVSTIVIDAIPGASETNTVTIIGQDELRTRPSFSFFVLSGTGFRLDNT